jgi:hypothetical protein
VRRSLVSLLLIAVSFAVVPTQAGAQTQSTTCDVVATATFDPGLTFTTRNQTITVRRGELNNCVGGGVTSGLFRARGSGQMSCTSGSGTGRAGIRWNTLETSIADLTLTAAGDFSGMVTSGKFAGEPITGSGTAQPGPGDCIIRPIRSARITGTISL